MKFNMKRIQARAMQAAGLGVGAAAGRLVDNGLQKMFPGKTTAKINAGVRLGIGLLAPDLANLKPGFLMDMANGLLGSAALDLGKAFGLPGLGSIEGYGDNPMGDYRTADEYMPGEGAAEN